MKLKHREKGHHIIAPIKIKFLVVICNIMQWNDYEPLCECFTLYITISKC